MKKNSLNGRSVYDPLKKTLMIMRFALIFMVLGIVQLQAAKTYSQKTRLSFNFSRT